MSEVKPEEDRKSIESRRAKAKEVIDGYSKIIAKCEQMRSEIEQRCKNVTVTINRAEHLSVMDAIGRLFGIETTEITFEMYKQCIDKLAKMTKDRIPKLGDK
jgi:vacuolar-type H+-ATPase subunit D/Vma8